MSIYEVILQWPINSLFVFVFIQIDKQYLLDGTQHNYLILLNNCAHKFLNALTVGNLAPDLNTTDRSDAAR